MDRIFQRLLEDNFSELDGLTVDASVPVPEDLLNELIAVAIQGNKKITACEVVIGAGNRVSASIKTSLLPWVLNLKLRLDEAVDLTNSPKIRIWLENNALLGTLGSLFNAFPEGIQVHDNRITIDLGAFLQAPEQKSILALVKSARITTEAQKVIVDVRLRVE